MPPVLPDETRVAAFAEFVKETEPRLRRALSVAFGVQLGAEALSDAFAYAWENWDRVTQMENPAGYLYRVGRSRARPRKAPLPTFPEAPADGSPWIEPGLPSALGRLTESQRVVVWLIHGFEWTQGEVADLLGVSISSVRKHLARGERKLRSALGARA
jgi:RNA polymerase sigma-70 factor (ECF subfamily)